MDDQFLISVGAADKAVLQWRLVDVPDEEEEGEDLVVEEEEDGSEEDNPFEVE